MVARTVRRSRPTPQVGAVGTEPRPGFALVAAVLGFFMVTLDAVVVNVALPSVRHELGGGIAGLQWVMDGYTLMFAALLLWSGALSDRVGARRAFGTGLAVFVAASAACGSAPDLVALVAARFVEGSAAAVLMPSSMALLGQAYPDAAERARAVAIWAMGGAIASSTGPLLGGVLTTVSWRWIFFVNVPVGIAAMSLVTRLAPSSRRRVPFDWWGQLSAVVAMGGLTYGVIEAGTAGFATPRVMVVVSVGVLALVGFFAAEARVGQPMVPLGLFRRRNVSVSVVAGFAFVVGYYGLPFVMSLYLQQLRHLSALGTGVSFLPMMIVGASLTPFSARLAERLGVRRVVVTGYLTMTAGLGMLALLPAATPLWTLSVLMTLPGLAGPLVMPPLTALLLNSVGEQQAGTASGVFNTSRQLGGALAVGVFGALLAQPGHLLDGVRISLALSAVVALIASAAGGLLRPPTPRACRLEGRAPEGVVA